MIDLICKLVYVLEWIREAPEHLETQELCIAVVQMEPCSLAYIPDRFKMQEMSHKAFY